MLIAAAVCPHPPVLFPEVARGAAPELDGLRRACDQAVGALAAAAPDRFVIVGAGPALRHHGPRTGGGLADYGVALQVGPPPARLPLSLTAGRWLAERAAAAPDALLEVADGLPPDRCRGLGAELAASAPRVAALVMGDGSARRSERSPGYLDERAAGFDDGVAAALGAADTEALAGLDPALSEALLAGGRPAWQVLAGAARGAGLRGDLLAYEAPYGVGYFVSLWTRPADSTAASARSTRSGAS